VVVERSEKEHIYVEWEEGEGVERRRDHEQEQSMLRGRCGNSGVGW
jgi:hypothetical protein